MRKSSPGSTDDLKDDSPGREGGGETALTDFCLVLMCLNEFVYVE